MLAVTGLMPRYGLPPQMVGGSGESLDDHDSPRDIVRLLRPPTSAADPPRAGPARGADPTVDQANWAWSAT